MPLRSRDANCCSLCAFSPYWGRFVPLKVGWLRHFNLVEAVSLMAIYFIFKWPSKYRTLSNSSLETSRNFSMQNSSTLQQNYSPVYTLYIINLDDPILLDMCHVPSSASSAGTCFARSWYCIQAVHGSIGPIDVSGSHSLRLQWIQPLGKFQSVIDVMVLKIAWRL